MTGSPHFGSLNTVGTSNIMAMNSVVLVPSSMFKGESTLYVSKSAGLRDLNNSACGKTEKRFEVLVSNVFEDLKEKQKHKQIRQS